MPSLLIIVSGCQAAHMTTPRRCALSRLHSHHPLHAARRYTAFDNTEEMWGSSTRVEGSIEHMEANVRTYGGYICTVFIRFVQLAQSLHILGINASR